MTRGRPGADGRSKQKYEVSRVRPTPRSTTLIYKLFCCGGLYQCFHCKDMNGSIVLLCALLLVQYSGSFGESLYDFVVPDTFGKPVALSKYRSAKAIIVVNIASRCETTALNLRELVELYDEFHDKGLEILAFPTNQFGGMEPLTNEEIIKFTQSQGVSFPVFAKIDVRGISAHPLYKFIIANTGNINASSLSIGLSQSLYVLLL